MDDAHELVRRVLEESFVRLHVLTGTQGSGKSVALGELASSAEKLDKFGAGTIPTVNNAEDYAERVHKVILNLFSTPRDQISLFRCQALLEDGAISDASTRFMRAHDTLVAQVAGSLEGVLSRERAVHALSSNNEMKNPIVFVDKGPFQLLYFESAVGRHIKNLEATGNNRQNVSEILKEATHIRNTMYLARLELIDSVFYFPRDERYLRSYGTRCTDRNWWIEMDVRHKLALGVALDEDERNVATSLRFYTTYDAIRHILPPVFEVPRNSDNLFVNTSAMYMLQWVSFMHGDTDSIEKAREYLRKNDLEGAIVSDDEFKKKEILEKRSCGPVQRSFFI